ncbi:ABC transporter ATP-binding protein [Gelidibacter salicanalis]|uniref:ATP-binding cassette domain-containing protein n=1 Tax=Gelidibacter salicanalis TaxID=291193 RepID=A0A934KMB4_9FLAO|nr:ATP-binding cassette domain-containing protein [Gelidibacter salicanalis]MBJ7882021.1 ATP-binding cassette domain-containing protein [Gelidibacter salicanalis]
MLKVNNISFGYNSEHGVFKDISLSLKPGEILGLYGKSGIGKTTFAKIIAGYLKPDTGSVVVDGETYPFKRRNPVQLIGQHPENTINPRWQMNQVLGESGVFSDEFLRELGISNEWMHRFPSQLSGGELQRFCLARALVPETKYLIADEMTTMLDAITKAQIWETVLQLIKQRQLGMLVISHEFPLLKRTCHRILDFEDLLGKN